MSRIEWTDVTWNPVRGCSRVSEGCRNCYAERMAARFSRQRGEDLPTGPTVVTEPFHGFAEMTKAGPRWTGRVELIPEKLDEPLHWRPRRRPCPSCHGASTSSDCRCGGAGVIGRRPLRIFVNSMSDLFHEALPDRDVESVFRMMVLADQHTFQVLTKRPVRMREFCFNRSRKHSETVPRNVWLGVSVEDQATADERIPLLLQSPAALRFVSYEPALGPVAFDDSRDWLTPNFVANPSGARLDWLIVGGESGPGARPCDVAWVRHVVRQCREAGVPCFVKQFGSVWARRQKYTFRPDPKGGDPQEWPEDLRVREFPA